MMNLSFERKNVYKLILMIGVVFSFFILSLPVFADESVSITPIQPIATTEQTDNTSSGINENPAKIPSVQIEDAANFVSGKVNDLVIGLQIIGKPICILIAVICVFMVLFGIVADPRLIHRGLIGVVIVAIAYLGIDNAPKIVEFIQSWASAGSEFLG